MTSVTEKRLVRVDIDELRRFKFALEKARDYHPVNRKLWLQIAGLIQRLEQQNAAESKDAGIPPS